MKFGSSSATANGNAPQRLDELAGFAFLIHLSRRALVYLQVARLDHWFKNLFLLAGGAVVFFTPEVEHISVHFFIQRTLLALFITCLASSSNYIINEGNYFHVTVVT